MKVITTTEVRKLRKIAKKSKALSNFLAKNTGPNDDWPIRIIVAKDCREDLENVINEFDKSLKEYYI